MRFQYLCFGTSLIVLACGVATARQDQGAMAEQAFKNIQSFKGQPASAILPAMRFMSASLGVGCDYCHVEDRASDEKQAKKTARNMLAMTKEIDDANFRGRTEVTCATCHAGHTHPMNLAPMPGADIRTTRSQDVNADQVLATYQAAVGGDAAANIHGASFEGTVLIAGRSAPYSSTQLDGKVYVKDGDKRMGFNGSQGWYGIGPKAQAIPPEDTQSIIRFGLVFFGPPTLPKLNQVRGGTAQIDGADVVVLSGAMPDSKDRASLFFDKKSGLLVRVEYLMPTILGSLPEILDYEDYKKVGGIEVPMKVGVHADFEDSIRTLKSVHINPKIDPAIFDLPK